MASTNCILGNANDLSQFDTKLAIMLFWLTAWYKIWETWKASTVISAFGSNSKFQSKTNDRELGWRHRPSKNTSMLIIWSKMPRRNIYKFPTINWPLNKNQPKTYFRVLKRFLIRWIQQSIHSTTNKETSWFCWNVSRVSCLQSYKNIVLS